MALKALLLRKKIDDNKKALAALLSKDSEFEAREAELAKSIEEVTEETTAEERNALDEMVAAFDADKEAHEGEKETLERKISDLEQELAEEEAAQDTEPPKAEEREEKKPMNTRSKVFAKMDYQEREAMFARSDVKDFLGEVRSCIREKRALQNVGLTIPTVLLGVLRQNIENYSKLYRHVAVRPVAGEGRMVIMGAIPEAIWTDCCANLNELDLTFNDVEVNCWKVGGFFAVCNANLEDSDVDLAAEILTALGQAIGYALDKAIVYGAGTRMPLGIVPRLAQTSQPVDYPATARTWVDLHTSNILTTAATGTALFAAIVGDLGAAKGKYSRGELVHVMNETTYGYLMAQAMAVDAAGAIVSRVNGTMPVVGGIIEVLDFIPDYNIVSGYFDLYLLAERAGAKFASSEHVRFLADQTVFKGVARYDGQPAIAEGFVAIGIGNQSVTTSKTFATDEANTVQSIRLNRTSATITTAGSVQLIAFTEPVSGAVTWESSNTAKATVSSAGLVEGAASGSATITATCNDLTAQCAVTVTNA